MKFLLKLKKHTLAIITASLIFSSAWAAEPHDPSRINYTKSDVERWLVETEQGNPSAQYNLGNAYADGFLLSQDYKEAARLWAKSAESGLALAQFNLGQAYLKGEGVEQNPSQAFEHTLDAAKGGLAEAQEQLAIMYALGIGVPSSYKSSYKQENPFLLDPELFEHKQKETELSTNHSWEDTFRLNGSTYKYPNETVFWYKKAAEQNMPRSQFNLGNAYANGRGVEKNLLEAITWWKRAADNGWAAAAYNLAATYHTGTGVERNEKMASLYFAKAYDLDFNKNNNLFVSDDFSLKGRLAYEFKKYDQILLLSLGLILGTIIGMTFSMLRGKFIKA